jgi:hypothetical protein
MTTQPYKTRVLGVPVNALSFTGAQDCVLAWGHARERCGAGQGYAWRLYRRVK